VIASEISFLGLSQAEGREFYNSGENKQEKVLCGGIMYIIIDFLGLR
jgi:hypothetical protein